MYTNRGSLHQSQIQSSSGRPHCSIWKAALAGAIGGLAGSFSMDVVSRLWTLGKHGRITPHEESLSHQGGRPDVEAAKNAGLHGGDPGAIATTVAADRITHSRQPALSPKERIWAGTAVHYSFGTAIGSLYGVGAAYVPAIRAQHGLLYGLIIWAGAEVTLPVFGLAARPTRYSTGEHLFGILSHAVFGLVAETTRKHTVRRLMSEEHGCS